MNEERFNNWTDVDNMKDHIRILEQRVDFMREKLEMLDKQEPVSLVVATAPKRIWLDLGFDPSEEDEISFHDLADATWSDDNATGNGIEYIRADTSPPQRKPLTDEQIEQLEQDTCAMDFPETVRAIEAKLKERNT